MGCAKGLFCGQDNCAKFHEIGAATGITPGADCCEGKFLRHFTSLESDLDNRPGTRNVVSFCVFFNTVS